MKTKLLNSEIKVGKSQVRRKWDGRRSKMKRCKLQTKGIMSIVKPGTAVSYTHLDVYKRQEWNSTSDFFTKYQESQPLNSWNHEKEHHRFYKS